MTPRFVLSLCCALLIGIAPAWAEESAATRLAELGRSICKKGFPLTSVEILRVQPGMLFQFRVTPAQLEKVWHYKLTVRELNNDEIGEKLKVVLGAVSARALVGGNESVDVRWGFVFYSNEPGGRRIGAFYLDESGTLGLVDNTAIAVGSDFLPKLKRALRVSID